MPLESHLLNNEDYDRIHEFCERHYNRENSYDRPLQFLKYASGLNPIFAGFLGEWCIRQLLGETDVEAYLAQIPRYESDDGDLKLKGLTFDVKTKVWEGDFTNLYKSDRLFAHVEKRIVEKDFLDAFIFCIHTPHDRRVYPMGLMSKGKFVKRALLRLKGDTYPNSNSKIRQDCYLINYKHLYPIEALIDFRYNRL